MMSKQNHIWLNHTFISIEEGLKVESVMIALVTIDNAKTPSKVEVILKGLCIYL
jgi:hypothetical protein